QNPVDLGVSVVQAGGLRLLRAYGTFPHPNIFGGFMAIGAICATWLSIQRPSLGVREGAPMSIGAGELGLAGLFTFSLFLSFSRSAWIGFAVALIVIVILNLKNWRRLLAPILICIAVFGVSTFVYKDFVISRSGIVESRTEQISNASRIQSYALGLEIYRLHPLAGSGPNNELAVYASANNITQSPAPLEPPHSFWLMLLDDFGLIGSLFMLTAICFVIITIYKRRKKLDRETLALAFSVSACWFVVSILDHYVWSLWPGQVLTALTVTLAAITISSHQLADKTLDC
ncbi:MAG: O-antigen ligase family protein, partial [Patescibacteria group bacterium]